MTSNTPLRDLGFRKRPEKKKKSRRKTRQRMPAGPPTNTTLDKMHNEFINMNRYLPPDAPPETGIKSEHTDMIEKTDESGFVNYFAGKWREGYPS